MGRGGMKGKRRRGGGCQDGRVEDGGQDGSQDGGQDGSQDGG